MGFLVDIAEIAGLLFLAYMAGWLVGYFVHRLIARAPQLGAAAVTQPVAAPAPDADALVKAPVVVPVASAPPPQVLATATALEPMKATAVPDADEPEPMPAAAPTAPVSALDTLKSLSTAIPLMPVEEPAEAVAASPEPPTEVPTPVTAMEPVAEAPAAPAEAAESSPPVAPVAPIVEPAAPIATVETAEPAAPAAAPAPKEEPASLAAPDPAAPPPPPVETAAPPITRAEPIRVVPPKADAAPARVKPKIRVAPATQAGEIAARPIEPSPMPASAPGMPWAGAIKGQEAQKFALDAEPGTARTAVAPEPEEPIAEPDAALDVALLSSIADQLKLAPGTPATDNDQVPAALDAPAQPAPAQTVIAADEPPSAPSEPTVPEPASSSADPVVAAPQLPPTPADPAPTAAAPVPPPAPRRATLDEDAAMRAIEGGWSRRDVRALSDAPEYTDVSAAVSAAQMAVEQVLARNGVDAVEPDARAQASFGKPVGLPQPRDGRRDSLKRIDGLGPLDEVTLNNLGIYHFDQIAKWTEREVLWLENHAFAVGRIAREDWQEQARELIAERDATRALR